jgi:hypothetical protein
MVESSENCKKGGENSEIISRKRVASVQRFRRHKRRTRDRREKREKTL